MHGRRLVSLLLMTDMNDHESRRSTALSLTYGGILVALAWLFLILPDVFPIGRLFTYLLSSLATVAAFHILGSRGSVLVYLATGVLAFIWPGILRSLLYLLGVGLLPIMILRLRDRVSLTSLRIIVHAVMTTILIGMIFLFGVDRLFKRMLWVSRRDLVLVAILLFQVVIVIYFYVFNLFERLFLRRILPYIRRHN